MGSDRQSNSLKSGTSRFGCCDGGGEELFTKRERMGGELASRGEKEI